MTTEKKRMSREGRREVAKRVAAMPIEIRKHRMHCIRLKTMIRVETDKSQGATQEIHRLAEGVGGKHDFLRRSISGAMGIQQRDKASAQKHARALQLAYAFIRGKPYMAAEQRCYTRPPGLWRRVHRIVSKITQHDPATMQRLAQWTDTARMCPIATRRPRKRSGRREVSSDFRQVMPVMTMAAAGGPAGDGTVA